MTRLDCISVGMQSFLLYRKRDIKGDRMVTINGEQKDLAGQNLYQYLSNEGFDLNRVVVERNLEIIPKEILAEIQIEENDSIEVLNFVGGG